MHYCSFINYAIQGAFRPGVGNVRRHFIWVHVTACCSGRPAPLMNAHSTNGASASKQIHQADSGNFTASPAQGSSHAMSMMTTPIVTLECEPQRRASH